MLHRNQYFIRERAGLLKLSDTYDLLDPQTQTQIGIAKEKPGKWIHVLRFIVNKVILPTRVFVYEGENPEDENRLLFSIYKPFTWWGAKVQVLDKAGQVLGCFQFKALAFKKTFKVFNAQNQEIASMQGDWKAWNFQLVDPQGKELGTITKKWAGIAKELFTSADNYIVALHGHPDPQQATLLLAAGLAIDVVYKEGKG